MNSLDEERSREFARLVMGGTTNAIDVDALISSADSLREFRVALLLKLEHKNSTAAKVVSTWRKKVSGKPARGDSNDLMHTVELLKLKQTEIHRQLTESTVEVLERLKTIDSFVAMQDRLRERLSEIDELVDQVRRHMETAERRAGNEGAKS